MTSTAAIAISLLFQGHMDSLQNVDLPLRDLIGVVIEHLSDSDSSDEDREETESEEEMETKKEDFLSPSRTKIASPRNSSRRPRNRRPQTTQKDEGMERKFPSLGATFQAEVPSLPQAPGAEGEGESCHEGSRCVWSSSSPHVLPSGASLESPSRINDVSVHSTPVSRAKPSGAPLERDTVDRGGPAFDERSIPCYWAQESRIALLNGNQAAPTASKSSNPSSASKPRTVSDDEQTALDELVDRTLYAAMLAQYLPGMVVTYIKGAEAEGKAAGPETGSSGPYKSKEDRDKDRERDRGEDYLHTNRSSKRISMVTGAGVKSARFGCVVRGPFFPNGSSSLTPSVCGAAAVVLDPDLPSSSSATSDGTPVTFKPQAPSFLRQAMMTLYTGLLDEVE